MLRSSLPGGNAEPSDPAPGFAASGLPDDFSAFMADALAGEPAITGADVDAMWVAEQQLRDAERELSDAILEGIALNMTLTQALAETFPFLRAG